MYYQSIRLNSLNQASQLTINLASYFSPLPCSPSLKTKQSAYLLYSLSYSENQISTNTYLKYFYLFLYLKLKTALTI